MTKPSRAKGAAATSVAIVGAATLPLLAAAFFLPAPADAAVSTFAAGGLPLAWAAAVAMAVGERRLFGPALAAALPFSAYALAAYSPGPCLAWFLALAAASGSAALLCALAGKGRSLVDRPGRLRLALRILIGAGPGLAAASLGSPLGSLGLSALAAALALLWATRRPR